MTEDKSKYEDGDPLDAETLTDKIGRIAAFEARQIVKSVIIVAAIVVAIIVGLFVWRLAHIEERITDSVETQKVRTVLCSILTQGDHQTYELAVEKPNIITSQVLLKSLQQSAKYREEIGPAPKCDNHITEFAKKVKNEVP